MKRLIEIVPSQTGKRAALDTLVWYHALSLGCEKKGERTLARKYQEAFTSAYDSAASHTQASIDAIKGFIAPRPPSESFVEQPPVRTGGNPRLRNKTRVMDGVAVTSVMLAMPIEYLEEIQKIHPDVSKNGAVALFVQEALLK